MDGAKARVDGVHAAATTVSAAALDDARFGFHRAHPHRSAKRRLHATQTVSIVLLIALICTAFYVAPTLMLAASYIGLVLLFAAAITLRLFAAAQLSPKLYRLANQARLPTYTILCPLYREANVVADLVAALARLDYPANALDIKLLVEGDDADTVDAAIRAAANAAHIEVVIVPPAAPRTKPKALNVGLTRAMGAYVVVYDAEDRPHPQQLRAALAAFEDGGGDLACVQAPLSVDNAGASWIARQFAAEYAIQFREMLPLLASLKLPLPLGGTSNHFRVDILRAVGGWDPYNVTEDADLGFRLAREGFRSDMTGPPTCEEAPVTFNAWLNQRARWIKGHMQTWLVLMRNPWRTAREMGPLKFVAMQITLGGGILAAFAHGPLAFIILVAALSPYDLKPADFTLALLGYTTALFAALTASALSGSLSHARAALTMCFYWPLGTIAAWRALFELIVRPHHWAKTTHGVSPRSAGLPVLKLQPSADRASVIAATSASF